MVDLITIETAKMLVPPVVLTTLLTYAIVKTFFTPEISTPEIRLKLKRQKKILTAIVAGVVSLLYINTMRSGTFGETVSNVLMAWAFSVLVYLNGGRLVLDKTIGKFLGKK